MSYDIELIHPVTRATLLLDAPHHMRGGTYPVGGETHARLNVTYNYAKAFSKAFNNPEGVKILNGKSAAESIQLIKDALPLLADNVTEDYWEPTEGNAKSVLTQLLALAYMRPDGIWEVT